MDKYKKVISLVASLILVLIIGTPSAFSLEEQLYKYDSSSGKIIKSEDAVYILEKPITKNINDGKITIDSFVISNDKEKILSKARKSLDIEESVENITGFEYIKSIVTTYKRNLVLISLSLT